VEEGCSERAVVCIGKAMIAAQVVLVSVLALFVYGQQIVLACQARGRLWQLGEQRLRRRVQVTRGIGGDVIARNGLVREGIENAGGAGEIPGAFRQGGNAEQVRRRLPGPLAIVIDKEK